MSDDAPVYLNVAFALYQVAYGEDSEDQYELADRIMTEVARRRGIAHPADSIPDLLRQYGEARHNAAMEGERGTYRDALTAEVQAEEAFTRVLELLAERDKTIAHLRQRIELTDKEVAVVRKTLGTTLLTLGERDATIAQLSVDRDRAVARIGVLDERVTTWKTRLVNETETLRGYLAEAREQVAQLTAERNAMRQALEALATHAYSHRDELTDLLDNHAVRLATGETCVLGMPMTCSDAHSAGHCAKPRDAVTNTTAVSIPVIGEVDARSCPAHGCPRVLCECPPARDEASGTTAGGDDRG